MHHDPLYPTNYRSLGHSPLTVYSSALVLAMTTDTIKPDTEVVIVGAGPVGLIIALMIAKQGIKCTLIEAAGEIIQSPRAMAYGPAAVVELERAGVAAECREIGMEPADYEFTLRWITIDNKLVADLSSKLMDGYPPVMCGQHKVAEVILKHLQKYDNARVLWNHKVVGIEQDKDTVTAICDTDNGPVRVSGQYLVGADGARSTVRKLIGCTFDGFTYDKMVVATNVFYPFREHGFAAGQFIIHPEHFAMVFPPAAGGNCRSAKSHRMACTAYPTAKMHPCHMKKHEPISTTNSTLSSLVPNPSNTICECSHPTNCINGDRINSELDGFFSRVTRRTRATRSGEWD